MENFSKLWNWLRTLPIWLRAIVLTLFACLALIASMSLSACGLTRAVVHNGAHGTSTEIKITTANPTTVTASPNVQLGKPLQNGFYLFTVMLILACGRSVKSQFMIESSCEQFARNKLRKYIDSEFSTSSCRCGFKILNCMRFIKK